jgi:hypothetical protein
MIAEEVDIKGLFDWMEKSMAPILSEYGIQPIRI